jgi:hypothetical protein
VCLFHFAREAVGATGTRHSPRPLKGRKNLAQLGRYTRRGIAKLRATHSIVIARESGRSSIPETSAMESKRRGVLDTPQAPGMTTWNRKQRKSAKALGALSFSLSRHFPSASKRIMVPPDSAIGGQGSSIYIKGLAGV